MMPDRKCSIESLLWSVIALAAVLLSMTGCQSRTTAPILPAQLKLGFSLQSPEMASLVELVTLTMGYPDTTLVDTIPVIDGAIHDTLVVTNLAIIILGLLVLLALLLVFLASRRTKKHE